MFLAKPTKLAEGPVQPVCRDEKRASHQGNSNVPSTRRKRPTRKRRAANRNHPEQHREQYNLAMVLLIASPKRKRTNTDHNKRKRSMRDLATWKRTGD
jgi:hypothetical protein